MTIKAIQSRLVRKNIRLTKYEVEQLLIKLNLNTEVPTEFNAEYTELILKQLELEANIQESQIEDIQDVKRADAMIEQISENIVVPDEKFNSVDILDEYLEVEAIQDEVSNNPGFKNLILQGLPSQYKDFYDGYKSIAKIHSYTTELYTVSQSYTEVCELNLKLKDKLQAKNKYLKGFIFSTLFLIATTLIGFLNIQKINTYGGTYRINTDTMNQIK